MSYEVNRRLVARRGPLETSATVDPVTAGIIRGAFETICYDGMGQPVVNGECEAPIGSIMIRTLNDESTLTLNGEGRLDLR